MMRKIGRSISGIGILGLMGYIIYRNITENQYSYGLVAMVVAFFAFILFVYQCCNKRIEENRYKPILYVLLVVSVVANILLYIKTSYTPLADESTNWKMETANEWFEKTPRR